MTQRKIKIVDINPPKEHLQKRNKFSDFISDYGQTVLGFAFVGTLALWTVDSQKITNRMKHDLDSLDNAAAMMIKNNIVTQDSAGIPVQRVVMDATTLQEYKKTMEMAKIKAWQVATPWANENDKPDMK